jgi:hypothetical protein
MRWSPACEARRHVDALIVAIRTQIRNILPSAPASLLSNPLQSVGAVRRSPNIASAGGFEKIDTSLRPDQLQRHGQIQCVAHVNKTSFRIWR